MTARTIRLVARRELKAARKPFLISTAIILLVVAAGLVGLTIAERDGGEDNISIYGLGLVPGTPVELAAEVKLRLPEDQDILTAHFMSVEAAEEALRAGDVNLVVAGEDTVLWGPWVSRELAAGVVDALQTIGARNRGATLDLAPEETDWLLDSQLEFRTIEAAGDGLKAEEAAAAIAVIVMFGAIIAYGQWIGYSVAEEKGSRVVELILGAVPPHHLLTGKLAAVGSMGLVQMGLVGSVVVGYGLAADLVNIPDLALGLVLWMLLWFVLGYGFYGAVYAAGGSLVSDTHEASTTLTTLNLFPIAGYIVGLIAFSQGSDTAVLRTLSLIPMWAPMTMPGRIARGWATTWEVAASVVLMLVAIYAVIRLAGWVYQGGVARASSKLGWREALRSGRDLGSVR